MKFLGNLFGSGLSFFTGGGGFVCRRRHRCFRCRLDPGLPDRRLEGERDAKGRSVGTRPGDANRWRVAADTERRQRMHNAEWKGPGRSRQDRIILATMDEGERRRNRRPQGPNHQMEGKRPVRTLTRPASLVLLIVMLSGCSSRPEFTSRRRFRRRSSKVEPSSPAQDATKPCEPRSTRPTS